MASKINKTFIFDGSKYIDENGVEAPLMKKTYFRANNYNGSANLTDPDIIQFPNTDNKFSIKNNLTLFFAFQFGVTPLTTYGQNYYTWGVWALATGGYTFMINQNTGILSFKYFKSGSITISMDKAYNDGLEHFAFLVYDGTNVVITTDLESKTFAISSGGAMTYTGNPKLTFNGSDTGAYLNTNAYNGFLSHVCIWNQVKTLQQALDFNSIGLIFRADDCYNDQVSATQGTILTSRTFAQMNMQVFADPDADNYYYEQFICFDPSDNNTAALQLLNKKNYVGNGIGRPEIWNRTTRSGVDLNYWKISYLNQFDILNDIQSSFKDLIWIKNTYLPQNFSKDLQPVLSVTTLSSNPTSTQKSIWFSLIEVPETYHIITGIIGGGADDSTVINTALSSYQNVVLLNNKATISAPVQVNDNNNFYIVNSTIRLNNNMNCNIIRNSNFAGNSNISVYSIGNSMLDDNSANQNKSLYTITGGSYWNYFVFYFVKVSNLKVRGLYLYDSCAWNMPIHGCTNGLVENIRINSPNVNCQNRDGISIVYGSQNITVRFYSVYNFDDTIPILNWNNDPGSVWTAVYQNGTRDIKNINIYGVYTHANTKDTYIGRTNIIDILSMDSKIITNVNVTDIKHAPIRNDTTGVILSVQGNGNGLSNIKVKNIYGNVDKSTNPVIYVGTYEAQGQLPFSASDILIDNFNVIAITSPAQGYKGVLESKTFGGTIANLTINSNLYQNNVGTRFDTSGANLTNFNHTEEILY